jgi:hypothetical protein
VKRKKGKKTKKKKKEKKPGTDDNRISHHTTTEGQVTFRDLLPFLTPQQRLLVYRYSQESSCSIMVAALFFICLSAYLCLCVITHALFVITYGLFVNTPAAKSTSASIQVVRKTCKPMTESGR